MSVFRSVLMMLLAVISAAVPLWAAEGTDVDDLRREVDRLRKELLARPVEPLAIKEVSLQPCGPNATVATGQGRLTISGLLQVWYASYQNDSRGLFDKVGGNTDLIDTNETQDNDTFRVRRAELRFNLQVTENVAAVVMIDPAAEATSFPGMPNNQGQPLIKHVNNIAPELAGDFEGSTAQVRAVQLGSGAVPRLLQDAFINFHGIVPHHDFNIGQMVPALGEEGMRTSAQLDFVERSMIGQLAADERDLGVLAHGTWWDDRFQYWLGAFNGAGNYFGSAGVKRNRSDDNDNKDFNFRVLVRPIWNWETWGSLELGVSALMGWHGEAGGRDPIDNPVNGLNRASTYASYFNPWISYRPGGLMKGFWMRIEYYTIRDRNAPLWAADLYGNGVSPDYPYLQANPGPTCTRREEGYLAGGYRIANSIFCDSAPKWFRPFEFAARFDDMDDVQVADFVNPSHTRRHETKVVTAGINYYILGQNAKIQLNYNTFNNPCKELFHNVRHDNLVANFQVAF